MVASCAEAGDRILAAPDDFIDENVGHELESAAANILGQPERPQPALLRLGLDRFHCARRFLAAALENFLIGIDQLGKKTGNPIAKVLHLGTGLNFGNTLHGTSPGERAVSVD
jgi:hypothetical protein